MDNREKIAIQAIQCTHGFTSWKEKAVLSMLASYCNDNGEITFLPPSSLARQCQMSVPRVWIYLWQLVTHQLIEITYDAASDLYTYKLTISSKGKKHVR